MPTLNEHLPGSGVPLPGWKGRKDESVHRETAQFLSKLDFRHISSHISQKKPGFYLILLRNELRHRTLRDKRSLVE